MNAKTRILIVDDSPAVRDDLRTLLDLLENVEVVGEAASRADALQKAGDIQPDLVLMDLELSRPCACRVEMDGCTAIRQLKTALPALRIFALTVHGYPAAEQSARAAGADRFFVKGRDLERLLNEIEQF